MNIDIKHLCCDEFKDLCKSNNKFSDVVQKYVDGHPGIELDLAACGYYGEDDLLEYMWRYCLDLFIDLVV